MLTCACLLCLWCYSRWHWYTTELIPLVLCAPSLAVYLRPLCQWLLNHLLLKMSVVSMTMVCVVYHLSLQDPGGAQIGFLLGSLGVTVALSSEMTTKVLPKEEGKDHIVHFRG